MKPIDYDLKIMGILKKQRKIKGIKQLALANYLNMSESNYNKFEKGHKSLSIGRLKIAAVTLNLTLEEIIKIADDE